MATFTLFIFLFRKLFTSNRYDSSSDLSVNFFSSLTYLARSLQESVSCTWLSQCHGSCNNTKWQKNVEKCFSLSAQTLWFRWIMRIWKIIASFPRLLSLIFHGIYDSFCHTFNVSTDIHNHKKWFNTFFVFFMFSPNRKW